MYHQDVDVETEGVQVIDRAPSRASHRPNRPPLKRSNACYNAFPDLPPIRDSPTPPLDTLSSTDSGSSSSSSSDESEDDFKIDLTPLCPPSPPSPTSPCSESCSRSLFSSIDQEDWERSYDGFPPPPLHEPYSLSWPPTPPPQSALLRVSGQCDHYGWSNNALYEMKAGLWFRRQCAWWHYEEHCRYVLSLPTNAMDDGIAATYFFPSPPVLPPSRHIPCMSANGRLLPTSECVRTQPQLAADAACKASSDYFKPIYPRFGDIADLRDSLCEATDRRYYAVPTFKLRQLVFVREMDALRGQLRKAAGLAPPSPLARCWTPDSPASVYSQDTAIAASPTASATTFSDGLESATPSHPLATEWRFRWQMINHIFPTPPPPPVHAHPILPHWFHSPNLSPPPRPDTPLPDEAPSMFSSQSVIETEELAHEHESRAADDTFTVSVTAAPLSDDISFTEISSDLPTPLPVSSPVGISASPPTPPLQRTAVSMAADPSLESEPIVRLPSPSRARTAVSVAAPLAIPSRSRTTASTLAQELERAASHDTSSVRFSIHRPPPCPQSPRFSFMADSEDPFANEYTDV
ncbi:hypothetical protein K466DRAFT_661776 [Polyporus arcularius HHB13444]|uniref:Uncharacterized protein n=1 Tax=Polyporus arcularius HHB13444 TaxID=1314778 RepID=A0A5C3PIP3_9APHY|nr:hypothetical protein K466DRAFT_661776 [Polyporus arcularius HHB13444]